MCHLFKKKTILDSDVDLDHLADPDPYPLQPNIMLNYTFFQKNSIHYRNFWLSNMCKTFGRSRSGSRSESKRKLGSGSGSASKRCRATTLLQGGIHLPWDDSIILSRKQILNSTRVIFVALVWGSKGSGQTACRHQDQAHQEGVLSAHKKFSIRGFLDEMTTGNAVIRTRLTRKVFFLYTKSSL